METRTTCWEIEQNTFTNILDDDNNYTWYNPVSSAVLEKFQNDLNSLYCVIDDIPVSYLQIYTSPYNEINPNYPVFQFIARSQNQEYICMRRFLD